MFVRSNQDVRASPNDLGDAQSTAVFDAAFDECDSHQQVAWMLLSVQRMLGDIALGVDSD